MVRTTVTKGTILEGKVDSLHVYPKLHQTLALHTRVSGPQGTLILDKSVGEEAAATSTGEMEKLRSKWGTPRLSASIKPIRALPQKRTLWVGGEDYQTTVEIRRLTHQEFHIRRTTGSKDSEALSREKENEVHTWNSG